jgi:DNA-directed RNA polymerase omega subunit
MPIIYLEDILKQVDSKYLAVNIAAQRARQLNDERSLPMLMSNAEKPVSISLEALNEGKISYKELDQPVDTPEDSPFSSIHGDDEKVEVLEELHPSQERDDSDSDAPDEPEEGL